MNRSRMSILGAFWLLLVCACMTPSAGALTVEVIGAAGATLGANGEAASASAVSPDEDNAANAVGGRGGDAAPLIAPVAGDGGSADASATTAVSGFAAAYAEATGGEGGSAAQSGVFSSANASGGTGGSALVSAGAESADGDGAHASVTARGGAGGIGPGSPGVPGDGGSADASANAVSQGTGLASAFATAIGGVGGRFAFLPEPLSSPNGSGGDAIAMANASSEGEAIARAGAAGGYSRVLSEDLGVDGDALARAIASGSNGSATAMASTGGLDMSITMRASAFLNSTVTAEAQANASGGLPTTPADRVDAFAGMGSRPGSAAVEEAVEDSPQVAAAFTGDAIDIVLGLGRVDFTNLDNGDPSERNAQIEILVGVSALQQVVIGFMNPEFLLSGLDSLRFLAMHDGRLLADEQFDEVEEALDYFDDRVLNLGSGFEPECSIPGRPGESASCFVSPLVLDIAWRGSEQGSGFGVDLIVGLAPIPEPGTALLLVVGLAVLAARARRRRALI
jgi:hypothetical protein